MRKVLYACLLGTILRIKDADTWLPQHGLAAYLNIRLQICDTQLHSVSPVFCLTVLSIWYLLSISLFTNNRRAFQTLVLYFFFTKTINGTSHSLTSISVYHCLLLYYLFLSFPLLWEFWECTPAFLQVPPFLYHACLPFLCFGFFSEMNTSSRFMPPTA